jgi:hypothetical protein
MKNLIESISTDVSYSTPFKMSVGGNINNIDYKNNAFPIRKFKTLTKSFSVK